MIKSFQSSVVGVFLAFAVVASAHAGTRGISTDQPHTNGDGTVEVTDITVPPNTIAYSMLISFSPNAGPDSLSINGGTSIYCSAALLGCASNAYNADQITLLGPVAGLLSASSDIPFVLSNAAGTDATTDFPYTINTQVNDNSISPQMSSTGSLYLDWVKAYADYTDYGFGPVPAAANALLSPFAGDNLQFIAWQDTNPSTAFATTPFDPNGPDPFTYDSLVMAVWFVPATAVPEPMSLSIFGIGLAGAVMIRRRRTKVR